MRNTVRPAMVALALAGLAVGTATAGVTAATTGEGAAQHCVQDAATGAESCFGSFTEAMAYASGGEITDAPADAADAATDTGFQAEVAALAEGTTGSGGTTARTVSFTADNAADTIDGGNVIAATVYSGTAYTGDSLTIKVASPCEDDGDYDYYYNLNKWSDDIESVQAWGNCWIWLHEDADTWDGTRQGPYKSDTADLGDWNNRASRLGLS